MMKINFTLFRYGFKPIAERSRAKFAKIVLMSLAMGLSPWLTSCKDSNQQGDGPLIPQKEYSIGNAREWTEIEKEHAPTARRSVFEGKPAVLIEVSLKKTDQGHYIEKFGIMDMQGKELAVTTIKRERNPLTYAYFDIKLLPWSGKVKVFAKCNNHDLWVTEVRVSDLGV
jgi:desulfoferrodoxin (superoxide reductase-like protein)